MASLERYAEVRRRYPAAPMLMGIGNLTELTAADTTGVNALLIAMCEELGVRAVLTTEVIPWARGVVREVDIARRLMHHAVARQSLPKGVDDRLVTLKDPTVRAYPEAELRELQARVTDPAPLVEELVPAPDPVEACARLADLPFVVFLDSATHPDQVGRHTFLAADPATVVRSKGALTQQLGGDRWTRIAADPVAHVGAILEPFAAEPVPGIPPFQGGAAGYVGYDWGAQLERVPRTRYDDLAIPDAMLGLYDWVIAWDHQTEQAWVISTGIPERGTARRERAARRLAFV